MTADPLAPFLPAVQRWFRGALGEPTPPQTMGWPAIQQGRSALITAPTGSGKTLAAFLWGLNDLWSRGLEGEDVSGVQLLYISPLRALGNDIHRNLEVPLEGVRAEAERSGVDLPQVTRAIRSGDTPANERQAMVRHPPHVLITTPESLYLLLTSTRARRILTTVRTVIVDEVHALMESKRGVHLTLSLERLEELTGKPLQRIGLSATVKPLEEAARFLGGQTGTMPRDVTIVDAGGRKGIDLRVVSPVEDFRDLPGNTAWPSIARTVLDLVADHESSLIFVNDRTQVEKVTGLLNEIGPAELAQSHHGSLSRERRLAVEQALKRGEIPALVSTSSLELGIDIGAVDMVVQVSSPMSVARGLQRVGRGGHLLELTSVGRIVPKHRRDVLECAAVAHEMLGDRIESIRVPRNCLDVLAQQVTAMVAVEPWATQDLLRVVRQAYPYSGLSDTQFEGVLSMLAGRFPVRDFGGLRARVFWDEVEGEVRALPNAARLALTNGGTIPERGYYPAIHATEGTRLGELDEEFVFEAKIGNVFTLGTAAWRITDIRPDRVHVAPATGEQANAPFWKGEGLGRPYELGRQIGAFTREAHQRVHDPDFLSWVKGEASLDDASATNLRTFLLDQEEATSVVPTDRELLLESFRDELGDLRMVLHTPFGRRINAPWAMALTARLRTVLGVTVSVAYNDDGIVFRLPDADAPPPLESFTSVRSDSIEETISEELEGSPLLGAAFREAAERALVLRKAMPGKRTPLWLQRLRAGDLLELAREYPSFPVLVEAYRECLEEYFDLPGLRQVLRDVESGNVKVAYVETPYPSPFAAGHLYDFVASYLYDDDAPRAERHSQLLALNRELLKDILDERGLRDLLEPEAIEHVEAVLQRRADGWRARTGDELLNVLMHVGDLSEGEIGDRYEGDSAPVLADLAERGRIVQVEFGGAGARAARWIAVEDEPVYAAASRDKTPADGPDSALETLVRRFARTHGPFQPHEAATRFDTETGPVQRLLFRMEAEGRVSCGEFTPRVVGQEWCDEEALVQIHRRTLAVLRKQAEPVDAAAFARFLAEWHGCEAPAGTVHATHAAASEGHAAVRRALGQLSGFSLPADAWEREVLPKRAPGYRSEWLDRVVAGGDLFWLGSGGPGPSGRRVSFRRRGEMPAPAKTVGPAEGAQRRVVETLQREGASFLSDLERSTGLSFPELSRALWELVWSGYVTNDSFDPVRNFRGLPSTTTSEADAPTGRRSAAYGRRPARWLRQKVAERVSDSGSAGHGRWSLVPGAEIDRGDVVSGWALQLIDRYGIVTREAVAGEPDAPPWREISEALRVLEARGDVRRGLFLSGLSGVQYAAPEAVEALRRHSRPTRSEVARAGTPSLVNVLDPACPFGTVYPMPRPIGRGFDVPRAPGSYLVLWDGHAVLAIEGSGRVLSPLTPLETGELRSVLRLLGALVQQGGPAGDRARRRIVVERWGEHRVIDSPAGPVLEELGFQREPEGYVLWGYQADRISGPEPTASTAP